jgi:hypothetical protein
MTMMMEVGIGVAVIATGADMAEGDGLDKTQAVINGFLGE